MADCLGRAIRTGAGCGGWGGAPIRADPPGGGTGGGMGGRGGCMGGGIGGRGGCSSAGAVSREWDKRRVASLPRWKSAMQNNLDPSFVSIFLRKNIRIQDTELLLRVSVISYDPVELVNLRFEN